MLWKNSSSLAPKKVNVFSSAGKVMNSVISDAKCIVFNDYLQNNHITNGQCYAKLLSQLRKSITSKSPGKVTKIVFFSLGQCSRTRPCFLVFAVSDCGFEFVDHHPCSPDLVISDYHHQPCSPYLVTSDYHHHPCSPYLFTSDYQHHPCSPDWSHLLIITIPALLISSDLIIITIHALLVWSYLIIIAIPALLILFHLIIITISAFLIWSHLIIITIPALLILSHLIITCSQT